MTSLLVLPFAAADLQAQENYRIKPGDVLRIEVLEDSSIDRDTLVLPDGRVSVPMIGTVQVSGRNVDQVRAKIAAQLRPNFAAEPTVFVSLSSLSEPAPGGRELSIYMLGEVANPGILSVEPGTTFLQALAQGGGVTRFGATKRLQLRRSAANGQQHIFTFNVKDIIDGKSSLSTPTLRDGDVIIVPQRRLFE